MEGQVKTLLKSFITDDEIIELFVNKKTLSHWIKGLTHESINYKDNYEKYEFLGDSTLGYAFNLYLRDIVGIKEYAVSNNLLNYYMSKQYQPTIAKKIGLDRMLVINPKVKISEDILEDVFESFFGIFTLICRKLWQSEPERISSPVEYLVNFFKWYFSEMAVIDISKGEAINKSFFNEFYYFFSGESTETKNSWFYNPKNKSFFFNPQFAKTIGLYSKDLENMVLKVLTKKGYSSEDEYLDEVTDKFKQLGFNLEWLKYEKSKITFDTEYKNLAKENGYKRFVLHRNEKNSYNLLAQKVDPKTRESITEVLFSFDDSLDFTQLKEKAMKILDAKFISD